MRGLMFYLLLSLLGVSILSPTDSTQFVPDADLCYEENSSMPEYLGISNLEDLDY